MVLERTRRSARAAAVGSKQHACSPNYRRYVTLRFHGSRRRRRQFMSAILLSLAARQWRNCGGRLFLLDSTRPGGPAEEGLVVVVVVTSLVSLGWSAWRGALCVCVCVCVTT